MGTYLLTIGIIFALLTGLILVERLYRLFARRHPEFGPYRAESGCGSCGGCTGKSSCTTPDRAKQPLA